MNTRLPAVAAIPPAFCLAMLGFTLIAHAQPLPDLEPTDLIAPPAAVVGQSIAVAWTIQNQGGGEAMPTWVDGLYLSTNQVWEPQDTRLLQLTRSVSVESSAGYVQVYSVSLPAVSAGNYFLILRADDNANLAELNETNNTRALAIVIAAADLTPTALTAPATAVVGQQIQVSWTVKNQGAGDALSSWNDSVYLSKDAKLDPQDQHLGQFTRNLRVAVGADYTQVQTVGIPSSPPGNYFLVLRADSAGNLAEANEANNDRAVPLLLSASDLAPVTVTAPATAGARERVEVSWTIKNQGEVTAQPSWTDALFLSTDNAWDQEDMRLTAADRTLSLAPGSSYLVTTVFDIPNVPPGKYHLLLRNDHNGNVTEKTETNNVWTAPITIGLPNLAVVEVRAPAAALPGQTVQLVWRVKNQGTGSALPSWRDVVRLSPDEGWDSNDPVLADVSYDSPLSPQSDYLHVANVTLPQVAPTNYFLILRADANANVYEVNEGDNDRVIPILLARPDLKPLALAAPSTAFAGANVRLSWSVKNQGNGRAVPSWMDGFYLSSDNAWDSGDTFLGQFEANQPLAAAAEYSMTAVVQLPGDQTWSIEVIHGQHLAPFNAPDVKGNILREYWLGISGYSVVDLTGNSRFPNSPSGTDLLSNLSPPGNWQDNYGQRILGFLYPPVSGSYTFRIQSDDQSELWLSADDNPTNKVRIAWVPSATGSWTSYSQQKSLPTALTAGQKYYIEVLHKEGPGADHVTVGWQLPVASSRFLILRTDLNNNQPEANETNNILTVPITLTTPEFTPASLTARAGDGQATLTWSAVAGATNYQLYFSTNLPLTKATGTQIGDVTSPFVHTNLVNGQTYYYAVAAVLGGLEGVESAVAAAVPAATSRQSADLAPASLSAPARVGLRQAQSGAHAMGAFGPRARGPQGAF